MSRPTNETKIVWLNLHSKDPRKKPALEAIRRAAGVGGSRVTLVKVSKDGTLVQGSVLELGRTITVRLP